MSASFPTRVWSSCRRESNTRLTEKSPKHPKSARIYFTRHNAIWLTVELIVLWILAAPPVAKPWYDALLFQPWLSYGSAEIDSIDGVAKQSLKVQSKSGALLSVWYFAVPGSKKTVLISHGNGGTNAGRKELIEGLLAQNASVIIYDYAGYGESTGHASLNEILENGDAVYNYACTNLKIPPGSLVLLGESLGSGPTCQIAKEHECNSIILMAPFSSLMKLAKKKCPWLNLYPKSWFPYRDIDNRASLASCSKPLLILYGTQDLTIPSTDSEELHQACPASQLVAIADRGHIVYYPPTDEYTKALKDFLK